MAAKAAYFKERVNSVAKIVAVCTSPKKGMRKKNVGEAEFIRGYGIKDDAHAGNWHRQVSLLAMESIDKMTAKGLDVGPGDFAENITTHGIELFTLPIGTRMQMGEALVEVTQIGKECHSHCAIYEQAGDCVMPREGIFVRVHQGGAVKVEDAINFRNFITVGILIASDACSKGEREDGCIPAIEEAVKNIDGIVLEKQILPDERKEIADTIQNWADEKHLDLILISGGTGFSPRDITPEAVLDVVEKQAPGIPEAMRAASLAVTNRAVLSRSVAGIRGKSLIITLPGSPKAAKENLEAVLPALPHGIEILRGVAKNCAAK